MPKTIFHPGQFVSTEWESAETKAKFADHFIRFLTAEFKQTLFTHAFYNRLSMSFGHIAHYNRHTFYNTWFETSRQRLDFLAHTLEYVPCGDPRFTFSDVERAVRIEVRNMGLLSRYKLLVEAQTRTYELGQLDRLRKKYVDDPSVYADSTSAHCTVQRSGITHRMPADVQDREPATSLPAQTTLF